MPKKEKRRTCWICKGTIEEGERAILLDFYFMESYEETGDINYLMVYAHYSCVESIARERCEQGISNCWNPWLKYLPEDFDPADRLKAMRERNKPITLLKWMKKDER